jgi:hypothetical protein
MPTPSVGRDVHYVSYGTPQGEFTSQCRAAKITEVDPEDPAHVGLVALNPTGFFFHALNGFPPGAWQDEDGHAGGTWHWPERVGD